MPNATQQVRWRLDKTVAYQAGATVPEDLGRGTILRRLMIRLKGQLTVSGANNTVAKTLKGDEWAVVKMIEILVNDGTTLRRFTGDELWWINYFINTAAPRITPALGDGATANPSFDTTLCIPFMGFLGMKQTWNPTDFCLDTGALSNIQIRITWGSHTDVNADATGWTVNPSMEVYRLDSYFPAGMANPWYATSYLLEQVNNQSTGATPSLMQQLAVGGFQYAGFLLNTTNAAGTTDDPDVISNVRLRSGGQYFLNNFPVEVMRQSADMFQPLVPNGPSPTGATANYVGLRRSSASARGAWIYYPIVTDQYLTESIDSLGLAELILEVDTTKAGSIRILPFRYTPIRMG